MSRNASVGTGRPLAMSANGSQPPGCSTRQISSKTARLSTHRLMTPLEITASAQPSSTGRCSARPSRNSTCVKPSASAVARDLASISGVMSTPTTRPVSPTWPAATKLSKPAPEPTSTTRSPDRSGRSENGLPTPAKDSTARSGSPSTAAGSYPNRAASGLPVWKWKERFGSVATSRYLSRTCSRSASGSTSGSSAVTVHSVPGCHRQSGSLPLGKPVEQSPRRESLAVELPHGIVGVHAVRPAAVGHDLGVLRQGAQSAAQLGDRHRPRPGDVPGRVLDLRSHVEDHHLAPPQAGGELLPADDLDPVAVAEIGVGQTLDAGD